jgi:hypothetical protein
MDVKVFSLDAQKNKIYDRRTRKYFDEVYKSYASGCYRSATVMLWSVVVCDIIFKLKELKELYADKSAEKILSEIEIKQREEPYSSKWEKELVKLVFERTQLLDTASNHKIMMIQNHRNLSAHPIINDEDTLFEPTEEMVRSDIRNSIETILSKPPFLTQKILTTIVEDLEGIKDLFPRDTTLSNYLNAKFLNNLTTDVKIKIFRGLWKFCFKSEEEKPKENRGINLRALKLIFQKDRAIIIEAIKHETKYYSSISKEEDALKSLVDFMSVEHEVYMALDDSAKELIKQVLKENFSYFGIAFFMYESPAKHLKAITKWICDNYYKKFGDDGNFLNPEHLKKLKQVTEEFGLEEEYRNFGIACFINSFDFKRADIYFDRDIEPNLEKYDEDALKFLLEGTNKNAQCYWRNRGKKDSLKILREAKGKFDHDFDFSIYENLPTDKMNDKIEDEVKDIMEDKVEVEVEVEIEDEVGKA